MKKRKLTLNTLTVNSFVTNLDLNLQDTVKGGSAFLQLSDTFTSRGNKLCTVTSDPII